MARIGDGRNDSAHNVNGQRNSNGSVGASLLPWGISLIGGVVVFVWSQINPKVDIGNVETRLTEEMRQADAQLKKDITEVKQMVADRLTIATHDEFKLRKDKDTERHDADIQRLIDSRVNRTEFARELGNVNDRVAAVRTMVEKLQADMYGSYNVGKQLDNLQQQQVKQAEITAAQIQDLRRALDMRPPMPLK